MSELEPLSIVPAHQDVYLFASSSDFGVELFKTKVLVTGLDQGSTESLDDITLYPNPVDDSFTLTSNSLSTISKVNVYDVKGYKVMEFETTESSIELDAEKLPAGLYVAKVMLGGKSVVKRFLKH